MKTLVKEIELDNSLMVQVFDTTRRYYEDYHLVRVEFECEISLEEHFFDETEEAVKARKVFGDSTLYQRKVEKMGVPFAHIERAREEIIASFLATSVPYLGSESFPRRFVASELEKTLKNRNRIFPE